MVGIVLFVKNLEITSFGKFMCFENNIKSLLNVAKRILVNGIRHCGIETHDIHR